MSHYVVTGGAGFIGSAIVRALLRENAARVVVLDNLFGGKEANLEEVRWAIDFQRADIRNYEEIAPLIRGAAVVFHEVWWDANVFADVTPAIRFGLEYSHFQQTYGSGVQAPDQRVQLSGFFIF